MTITTSCCTTNATERLLFAFIAVLLLLLVIVMVQSNSQFPQNYIKTQNLKFGLLSLQWKVDIQNNQIAFLVNSNVTGWIGIGFQRTDEQRHQQYGMIGCDMVIATLEQKNRSEEESVVVGDYWADNLQMPVLDLQLGGTSDITARAGQTNGKTWMEFIRPIASSDHFDNPLNATITGTTPAANLLLWAFSTSTSFGYHGVTRGTVWIDLFSAGTCVNGCSGNGRCASGSCYCNPQWQGADCSGVIPPDSIFPSLYPHTLSLNSFYTLSWKLLTSSSFPPRPTIAFRVSLVTEGGEGWVALGLNPSDRGMLDLDVVVLSFSTNGTVLVEDYYSNTYAAPQPDSYLGGTNDVLARGGVDNGITWFEFVRELVTGDRYDSPIITTGLNKITWAYGNTPKMSYHQSTSRGFAWVDLFATGACPNRCFGLGYCNTSGRCLCYEGWTGDDCSVQIPKINSSLFPSSYPYTLLINSNIRVSWRSLSLPLLSFSSSFVTTNTPTHLAILVHTKAPGWIGIGFEPDDSGMMNDVDMVIATFVEDGTEVALVNDYWSVRPEKPTLDTALGGLDSVLVGRGGSGSWSGMNRNGSEDGGSWMEFIRPIRAEDPYDRALNTSRPVRVVWAYGSTPGLSRHDANDRGSLWIDFFQSQSCPNDCNGNGVCNVSSSICVCNDGWVGEDCSIKQLSTFQFPKSFDYKIDLEIGITLSWSIVNHTYLALQLTRPRQGWIGVGFGSDDGDGGMTRTDMYIATIISDMAVVMDYWSEGSTIPETDVELGGKDDVVYYSGRISGIDMIVSFVRPLKASDSETDVEVKEGLMNFCYALGFTNSLSQHSSSNAQKLQINFFTGVVHESISLNLILRYIHGSLMFGSWGVIILGGMMWARYFRQSEARVHGVPQWFYVHRITQYLGFVLSSIGFAIGISMTKVHFKTMFHAQLGVVVIFLSVCQLLYAYFRPQASPGGQKTQSRKIWEVTHRWNGRLALLVSIPVVFSGLWEFGAPVLFLAIYGGYLLLVLLLAIGGDIFKHKLDQHKKKQAALEEQMFNEQQQKTAPMITFADAQPRAVARTPPPSARKADAASAAVAGTGAGSVHNTPTRGPYSPVLNSGVQVPPSIRNRSTGASPSSRSPIKNNNTVNNDKRLSSRQDIQGDAAGMPKMSSFDVDPYADSKGENKATSISSIDTIDDRSYQPGQYFV